MRSLLIACCLILSGSVFLGAQQLPLFPQYRDNQALLNPGALNQDYLVFGNNLAIGLGYRSQWNGGKLQLDNGKSQAFGAETITGQFEYLLPGSKLFVGGHFIDDESGNVGMLGGKARIGYVLSDDPSRGGLSLGLHGGVARYAFDLVSPGLYDYAVQYDISDPDFDPEVRHLYGDVGFGLFYYKIGYKVGDPVGADSTGRRYRDTWYVGASMPQLFGLRTDRAGSLNDLGSDTYPLFAVMGGWMKYFGPTSFFEISANVKRLPDTRFHADASLRAHFFNTLWVGMGASVPLVSNSTCTDCPIDENLQGKTLEEIGGMSNAFYNASSLLFEAGVLIGGNAGLENRNIRLGFTFNVPLGSYANAFGNTFQFSVAYTMRTAEKGPRAEELPEPPLSQ